MAGDTREKSPWTIKRLLEWTAKHFTQAQVEQPRLCAELLLAHVLGWQRLDLYLRFNQCPSDDQLARFRNLVKRCAAHEPVAYLIGRAHFYSLEFEVGPAVLLPRRETEVLVAGAIEFCRHETYRPAVDVLDLCTGTGCIAIAVAANVVETEIVALDRSAAALEIAAKNVEKHDLTGRIHLLRSDLFENLEQTPKNIFDLMVANPPYVCAAEYEKLPPHIRDYEPHEALFAGADGLRVHRRILAEAEPFLADAGAVMLETAYNQAEQVMALCENCGYLTDIAAIRDQLGHKRVVTARKK